MVIKGDTRSLDYSTHEDLMGLLGGEVEKPPY